jgi:hypothetical protein
MASRAAISYLIFSQYSKISVAYTKYVSSARKRPLTKSVWLANGLISFAVLAEHVVELQMGGGVIFEVSRARSVGARSAHPMASVASVRP